MPTCPPRAASTKQGPTQTHAQRASSRALGREKAVMKAGPDAGKRNRRPHSDATDSPLQEDALEEATAPALRPAGHGVHYAVAGTAEHLAVGPVKYMWSGSGAAVVLRERYSCACDRVSRGVLAVRLASGSRPAPNPEWSAQVATRTTCTTEKDCPSCLRPSCRPDRNSRSQTACAGWPAHAWREVGGR